MDEMMFRYLKSKGMNEDSFRNKFSTFMNRYKRNSMRNRGYNNDFFPMEDYNSYRRHGNPDDFMDMFKDRNYSRHGYSGIEDDDMYHMMRYMRDSMNDERFTVKEAKETVYEMYHTEGGRKHSGERFDMQKAEEVLDKYKSIIPANITAADVYVAINSQYHDYAELFKNWFGGENEQKIIESAIVYWFKDADCKSENKVVEYLKGW